jgi:DNA-binding transcriptional LysR family regulator
MSFLTLDLNLLRVFDAVMTEQNLTRAAGHLAMTQPAVSNAIKRLRESLGDELLIRTAYGVKPTPRAEALWPAVRQSLAALEAAVMPETFDVSKAQATFRMASTPPSRRPWPSGKSPGVNIRMVPLTTREPRPMLLRGDIDLAVGFFPGVAAQLSSDTSSPIRHERLYSGQYVCVMRKDHPLARVKLDLDNYCKANHLLVSFSGRAHGLVDEALTQIGRERRIFADRQSILYSRARGGQLGLDYRVAKTLDRLDRDGRFAGVARVADFTASRPPGHAVARTRWPQPRASLVARQPRADVVGSDAGDYTAGDGSDVHVRQRAVGALNANDGAVTPGSRFSTGVISANRRNDIAGMLRMPQASLNGQLRRVLDFFHHCIRVRFAHTFLQQRFAEELAVCRHVLHARLDQIIEAARHHVALEHFRNGLHALLESVEHFRRGAVQHHFDEHQQRHVQKLRIQLGRVAHDVA